jgi:hypothetical protein
VNEMGWHCMLNCSAMQELQDLQTAANGGVVEKAHYFENCVERRLRDIPTGEPSEHKPFTFEQKRKLSVACSRISDADCAAVLDIISQSAQLLPQNDGEIAVTIDALPDSVLYRIQVPFPSVLLVPSFGFSDGC